MSNLQQIIEDNKLLVDDAFDAFRQHFNSREGFLTECDRISDHEKKNRFLRLASLYNVLVKDGNFKVSPKYLSKYGGNFYDTTYKFIALSSIIEAVNSKDEHLDFYEWLKNKKHYSINNKQELEDLYQDYKSDYGAINNFVKFFEKLQQDEQEFLKKELVILEKSKKTNLLAPKEESTITDLARLLYNIRSKFMHNAKITLALEGVGFISARKGRNEKAFVSNLKLSSLMRIFEKELLRYFGLIPERNVRII
jgi:hypothetical protein